MCLLGCARPPRSATEARHAPCSLRGAMPVFPWQLRDALTTEELPP